MNVHRRKHISGCNVQDEQLLYLVAAAVGPDGKVSYEKKDNNSKYIACNRRLSTDLDKKGIDNTNKRKINKISLFLLEFQVTNIDFKSM